MGWSKLLAIVGHQQHAFITICYQWNENDDDSDPSFYAMSETLSQPLPIDISLSFKLGKIFPSYFIQKYMV